MIIGITGGIGTGKTTVANLFRKLGAYVIDVDKIGHEILKKYSSVYKEVVDVFGMDILGSDMGINRAKLAKKAFSSSTSLHKLNKITHGQLVKKTKEEIREIKRRDSKGIIIIDAAVLVEGGFLPLVDKVILVVADKDQRLQRLINSRNMDMEDALNRINIQNHEDKWYRVADYVIDNSYDINITIERVQKIWEMLKHCER